MAKSIRSKWRRKCRAVKRERYGQKELEKLKKIVGADKPTEVQMTEVSEIANVRTVQEITTNKDDENNEDQMDVAEYSKKYHPKTLRNEHGAYPVWLHPRKYKKVSKKAKKQKGKINKRKNKK